MEFQNLFKQLSALFPLKRLVYWAETADRESSSADGIPVAHDLCLSLNINPITRGF